MTLAPDAARAFMPYPPVAVANAPHGPLAGLRFGVKDLFDVAGYPTSAGQPLILAMSGIKTRHAEVVTRLLAAGAAFAGKTITDELAFSMNGQNAHFGSPLNGAAPARIAGGSSSGSAAAVSNGLVDFALGTDTGGSVRAPASHCGLYGLRPTHARVSLAGCFDLAPSLDTCGWFTRDAATFGRVGEVLLGPDPAPLPPKVRLLFAQDLWPLATPQAQEALAPARARIEAALGGGRGAQPVAATLGDIDAMYWHFRHVQAREAWATDGPFIEAWHPPLGPGVADRFAWSREIDAAQGAAAYAFRELLRTHVTTLLGSDGVLILPTMPDIAPLRSDDEDALTDYRNQAIRLLCTAGLTGLPQLSLPLARRDSAPLGISLIGPAGSDRSLIALAESIERV